jgi:hypothetical protein
MIPANIIALILAVAVHSPELAAQVGTAWGDAEHGEGGGKKVAKVFADLAGIFGTVSGVASSVDPAAAQVHTGNQQVTG